MKVSFIGSPSSFKTTLAAMLFANLKQLGISCEFFPEYARAYIAQKRVNKKLQPKDKLILTDSDQATIMANQFETESIIQLSVGKSVLLITDSSPLNALFYMSEETRKDENVISYSHMSSILTDLVFYCPPMEFPGNFNSFDPNRIHDKNESLKIDQIIPIVLKEFSPEVFQKMIYLNGTVEERYGILHEAVLKHVLK